MSVLFDPSALPGDDPAGPNLAPDSAAAPFPEVRLFNPDGIPGDDPVFRAVTTPGPSQTVGPIDVSYQPDANAAVEIMPGALDASGNFTPGGTVYGPYLAAVTVKNGQYGLTVMTSDPVSGLVSIQPGDLSGGVFTAIGLPMLGTLATAPAQLPDIAWIIGPPQANVFDPGSSTLTAGSSGFIHIPVNAASSADGSSYDPTELPVAIAVTPGTATPTDFQGGDWLTITIPPGTNTADAAGTLARLAVSAFAAGVYLVTLQIDRGLCFQAGILRVQG